MDLGWFWVLEVLILAVPLFVAIWSIPQTDSIGRTKFETLVCIQAVGTVLNIIWALSRKSQ